MSASMNPKIAPEVALSLPVLQEVNVFSRFQLRPERTKEVPCFSSPVMNAWICNPTENTPLEGKDPDKDFCAIHWICKVFYAARLGVGLNPDEPYDFEKSKEFAKKLSYEALLKAIHSKVDEPVSSVTITELQQESKIEAIQQDAKILQIKKEQAPPPVVAKKTGLPPQVAKVEKPKVAQAVAIHGFNPGTLGHFLLSNLPINETFVAEAELWKITQAKGFNSEGRFHTMLKKLQDDLLVKSVEGQLQRTK